MSITTETPTDADEQPATDLRRRLRHNATFSGLGGLVAAVGCVPLADLIGVDAWWLLLGVGIGLLGFAGVVMVASQRPVGDLAAEALLITAADAGWVVVSVVLVVLGVFTAAGAAIVLAVAAVVAFFGISQTRCRRALLADPGRDPAQATG